jgi:hypothetical protein
MTRRLIAALALSTLPVAAAFADEAKLEALVKEKKGQVIRDDKAPGRPIVNVILVGAKLKDADLEPLAGVTTLKAVSLAYNPDLTDAGLKVVLKSEGLESATLIGTGLTDDGLKQITRLKKLNRLLLENTKVTDAGLKHLAEFPELRELGLGATDVTDAGMADVAKLKNLRALSLYNTAVGDPGLKHLAGLKNLTQLNLGMTKVTATGVKAFKEAVPSAAVSHDQFK